jgi:hypothetical protein
MTQWIQWKTQSGNPVQVGDVTLTPQSQALSFITPFGGFVWNRPTAVLVEQNGRTTSHPITDITLITLVAVAFLSLLLSRRTFSTRKSV